MTRNVIIGSLGNISDSSLSLRPRPYSRDCRLKTTGALPFLAWVPDGDAMLQIYPLNQTGFPIQEEEFNLVSCFVRRGGSEREREREGAGQGSEVHHRLVCLEGLGMRLNYFGLGPR